MVGVKIKMLDLEDLDLIPKSMTGGSAGLDIFSPERFNIGPGKTFVLPLGFALQIPEDFYITFVARSSVARKGIIIPNAPSTIDSDYREECMLMLHNVGKNEIGFERGQRVAQMILRRCEPMWLDIVDEIEPSETRKGGLGSTGA